MSLIFVDCEADFNSPCPGIGKGMTEFGAVHYPSRKSFHGHPKFFNSFNPEIVSNWTIVFVSLELWLSRLDKYHTFVSDNPAYDWQWINYYFHHTIGRNPFGFSARRIGDFYAGLTNNFVNANRWKKLRITKHDHNPVNDAMGNLEAFERMLKGDRA